MASFHYQALDRDGNLVSGKLEADSVDHASSLLQGQGLTAQSISRDTLATSPALDETSPPAHPHDRDAAHHAKPSIQNVEEAALRVHMAEILHRSRPIVPALRAYAAEMPAGWQRRQLAAVCRILERGDPNAAAAALVSLPESWIPLLSAATTAPDPGQILHEFLTESRRTEILRHQWWLTLAYPIVLLCLVMVVMTLLSIFVIPEFCAIFNEFDLSLPVITLWVLGVGQFLARSGILIIAALAGLLAIVLLNGNRLLPSSAFNWLTSRIHLPFGRRTSVARFARFTADLLEAGVGLPDALRIAAFTINRLRIRRSAWQLATDIEATGGFSQRAYRRPLTASVAYALAADLPTESRVRLLREISNSHADRTSINLSWASGVVEPIAILAVGIVVGLTVIGLFLPLVKLVEGLSN